MCRLLRKQFFKDYSRPELVCVGLVVGIRRDGERQRVEDPCFVVFRVLLGNASHGIAICVQAHLLWRAFKVPVQLADCRKIGAFALRSCTQLLASFGALLPKLQLSLGLLSRREGIAPIAKSDSPVCDGAGGVLPQSRVESVDGTAELEGMKQGDRTIELILRRCIAGCGEANLSHFLAIPMLVLLRHTAGGSERH
jgi:hypothetical protein